MIEKIKALCVKHREILVYLIVGGLTTVVSWAAKFLWNFLFYAGTSSPTVLQNTILSVVENAAGIAFAYPTNRKWVFQSKNPNILAEAGSFVGSRLATMGMSWLLNLLLTNALGIPMAVSTIVSAVFVCKRNQKVSTAQSFLIIIF